MCRYIGKVDSTNRRNQRKLIFRSIILRKFSLFDFTAQSTSVHYFTKLFDTLKNSLIADRSVVPSLIKVNRCMDRFRNCDIELSGSDNHGLTIEYTRIDVAKGPWRKFDSRKVRRCPQDGHGKQIFERQFEDIETAFKRPSLSQYQSPTRM